MMQLFIKKKLQCLILILLPFISIYCLEQPENPGISTSDAVISGTIKDSVTGENIEYAVIAIYKKADSSFVKGTSSSKNGNFIISNLAYGSYYSVISFVGYNKKIIDEIELNRNQKSFNIGIAELIPDILNINEVVVTSNKNSFEHRIDKKVIDLSSNITSSGGTVADALQNVPSLQTDIDGKVTLRGSSNFVVLVDGNPVNLSGSEALQQIPANTVQSVEIITNPSAKYDADGSSGIINVILKKHNITGLNGLMNLTSGTSNKNGININMNYKLPAYNFIFGSDFSDMNYPMSMYANGTKSLIDNSIKNQYRYGKGSVRRRVRAIKAGTEFSPDKKNMFSIITNTGQRIYNRGYNSDYDEFFSDYDGNDLYSFHYSNNNKSNVSLNYFNINTLYQLKLNDKGHRLSAAVYYSNGANDNLSYLYYDSTDVYRHSLDRGSTDIKTDKLSNEVELLFRIDYILPIDKKGKIEAGYSGKNIRDNGKYRAFNSGAEISGTSEKYNYSDGISAGYFTLSNSFTAFEYKLGIRAEYENRLHKQVYRNKRFQMERLDYFPSVHIMKQLPWNIGLSFAYSRRIDRPKYWIIDPFTIYLDPQTVQQGNPQILSQISNSFDLNAEKKINEKSVISAEGFCRISKNPVQQFIKSDPNSLLDTLTLINIKQDRTAGFELVANILPTDRININISGSIYNYTMSGINDPIFQNSINSWNLRVSPIFRLKWNTTLQLNYNYYGPTITAQGPGTGYYMSIIGVKKEFFKNKLSATLQIQNLVGETSTSTTIENINLHLYQKMGRESKVFLITLSYRLNHYKTQNKNDEIISYPDFTP